MTNSKNEKMVNGRKLFRRELQGSNYGFIFKSYKNFESRDKICYVPEFTEDETAEWVDERFGYTRMDIEDLCEEAGLNRNMARYVFETIDWQHPATLIEEMVWIEEENKGRVL